MSALNKRIAAMLQGKGAPNKVQLQARPSAAGVVLELARDSRREAKGDQRLSLSASACRDLMRTLQAAADESERLAYQRDKLARADGAELAAALTSLIKKGIT